MRARLTFLISFSVVAFAGVAFAQNRQSGRIPEGAAPSGNVRGASFNAPFADPGNLQAKELAAREGLSVGEATRRLRLMHKAGQLARRLEKQNSDSFGGMEVQSSAGGIRFKAHFVGGANSANNGRLASAAPDPEIASSTDVADSALSLSGLRQLGANLLQQLRQAGVDADFGVDPFSGHVTFLAKDTSALQAAITKGAVSPPPNYEIQRSEGIIPTATLIAGAAYNAQYGSAAECTTGFAVIQNSTTKGISTAGHCDLNSPAEYNATFASHYGDAGAIPLTFKQEWITNNLDFQWHTASSTYPVSPEFWEGSSAVTVTGAAQVYTGETLCKFGRTTGKTCANVNSQWWWDANYSGYYLRLDNTVPGQYLTYEGDSGGPVFSGSIAKGWIHGRDASGNAYFMPVTELYNKVPSMQVLCIC